MEPTLLFWCKWALLSRVGIFLPPATFGDPDEAISPLFKIGGSLTLTAHGFSLPNIDPVDSS